MDKDASRESLDSRSHHCEGGQARVLQVRSAATQPTLSQLISLCSENGVPPPGAVIAGRRIVEDPMDEAEYGERVPFIITMHGKSHKLVDKARAPEDLLNDRYVRGRRQTFPSFR